VSFIRKRYGSEIISKIAVKQRAVIQEAQLDFWALSQGSPQHAPGSIGYHRVEEYVRLAVISY
jgi:hypothetical protein